jgi:hypothetical protein
MIEVTIDNDEENIHSIHETETENDLMNDIMYSYDDINTIRNSIENMNKFNQIEILRIFKNNNVVLNENKYGIFINLTELPCNILDEVNSYIKYVNTQEKHLTNIEKQKEDYINTYFTKDIKDN